jgi:ribonucleoside-diphosphate reductase beta chain
VSRDRIDYQNLPEHEKHIFISNLKYQTLLDSIQGRSPNVACCPWCRFPSWKPGLKRGRFPKPSTRAPIPTSSAISCTSPLVFDDIVTNEYIIARAEEIACYYDDLINTPSITTFFGEGRAPSRGKTVHVSFARTEEKALSLPDVRQRAWKPSAFTCRLPARLPLPSAN